MIEPIPEDHNGSGRRQVEEISVEADSYEQGREALMAKLPEGWRMSSIRRTDY